MCCDHNQLENEQYSPKDVGRDDAVLEEGYPNSNVHRATHKTGNTPWQRVGGKADPIPHRPDQVVVQNVNWVRRGKPERKNPDSRESEVDRSLLRNEANNGAHLDGRAFFSPHLEFSFPNIQPGERSSEVDVF